MNKLLGAIMNLHKNKKKGFTLVELIVVIVIIAILIAALAPAILGAINRANVVADEADCRSVMMAGSVAGLGMAGGPDTPDADDIIAEFTGVSNVKSGTYTVYFNGAIAVGCSIAGGNARSKTQQSVGVLAGTAVTVVIA